MQKKLKTERTRPDKIDTKMCAIERNKRQIFRFVSVEHIKFFQALITAPGLELYGKQYTMIYFFLFFAQCGCVF